MTVTSFTLFLLLCSFGTGILGSITGLGGGIFLTPFLTLIAGVEPHYALGASLIAVICTSSGASIPFLKEGLTNYRIGLFLETAAVISAPFGALVAVYLSKKWIYLLFGGLLLNAAYSNIKRITPARRDFSHPSDALALSLNMPAEYTTTWGERIVYPVRRLKTAWGIMLSAGFLSGVLGIGSGWMKILAMDNVMGIPYRVSLGTGNFIMGITALASVGIYWQEGFIIPEIIMPVILGVLSGAYVGAKIVPAIPIMKIRFIFVIILGFFALQMLIRGIYA